MAFGFYADAGLTLPLEKLTFQQAADGSAAAFDAVAYFGAPVVGSKVEAESDPGVDPVYIAFADATAGVGVTPLHARLGLTSGDLATSLAGEPLSLGTEVLSGVAGAVAVHVRVDTPALAVGRYTDVSLVLPTLLEGPV